jgi:nucleoside-diphosphate-sugar epimerase|tara:strand:- start:20225 stop:21202 length:978 start_codon:yes stop_codon:yes gene_type:complete
MKNRDNMTKNKKILITGGLGFLGSYTIEKYKSKGYDITIIDNLSTNTIDVSDPICKGCNVIIMDILDYTWKKEDKFDMIIHLASPVGPAGILQHSGKMAGYILDDTYWAIKGAQLYDCPLIFISTSEIYGYREEAEMLQEHAYKLLVGDFEVRNEYSTAKLLGEIVISNTAKVSNLKYQIIRPFNISGARQLPDAGFVLPRFVTQALSGEDITVFGDGEQLRAFTYVKDIIDGIYLASVHNKNDIWNIGNPANKVSINYLANRVKELTNSKSDIIHIDPKTIYGPLYAEAWDKIPDPKKIQTSLDWQTTKNVDEIIKDVIEYWRS